MATFANLTVMGGDCVSVLRVCREVGHYDCLYISTVHLSNIKAAQRSEITSKKVGAFAKVVAIGYD